MNKVVEKKGKLCCDICNAALVTTNLNEGDFEVKTEIDTDVGFWEGADGCVTLNYSLRGYFIATKLLKQTRQQFFNVANLETEVDSKAPKKCGRKKGNCSFLEDGISNKGSKGAIREDNKLLYSIFCERCEKIVTEAIQVYKQMMGLQRTFDRLGETLQEIQIIANPNNSKVGQINSRSTSVNVEGREGVEIQRLKADDSENHTRDQMLGLSLACLGKVPFPPRRTPKQISSLKLRSGTRKVSLLKRNASELKLIRTFDNTKIDSHGSLDALCSEESQAPNNDTDVGVTVKVAKTDTTTDIYETKDIILGLHHAPSDNCGVETTIEEDVTFPVDNEDNDSDYDPSEGDDDLEHDRDYDDDDDDDDNDSDFEPLPKKKLKSTTAQPVGNSSSEDNDDDDDEDNVQIIGEDGNVCQRGGGSLHTTNLPILSRTSTGAAIRYQCKFCSKIFSSSTTIDEHRRKAHGEKLLYACPKCPNLNFQKKIEMIQHRNLVHGHVCDICSKKLSSGKNLVYHLKFVHKREIRYKCSQCDKVFMSHGERRIHCRKEHTLSTDVLRGLPPREPQNAKEEEWSKIPCGECGRVYMSGESLDVHLYMKHEARISKQERLAMRRKCCFCWKYFSLEQRYSVHLKIAHPEITKQEFQFKCCQCSVAFFTTSQLKEHFETKHEETHLHTCAQCKWPFLDAFSRKTHSNVHRRVIPDKKLARKALLATYQFKCWFCWEVFPDEQLLQRHFKMSRRHKRLKVEFPCDVESCEYNNRPFEKVEELNEHVSNCHSSSEAHVCHWCSWKFTSSGMLTLHKLDHLSPARGSHFKCPLCEHYSKKKTALKNHYNSVHELNLKICKCPRCPARFLSPVGVHHHILAEHNDPNQDVTQKIPCEECGRAFTTLKILKNHQRSTHRESRCSICSKVFTKANCLRKHMMIEHDVGQRYLCSVCGSSFLKRSELRVHSLTVHMEPQFECKICHQKLKSSGSLKQHMKRVHKPKKLNDPPPAFVCGECGKGYARKDTLDDHVRVNHTQDTYRIWTCDKCGRRFKRIGYLNDHLKGKGCPGRFDAPMILPNSNNQIVLK